LSQQEDVAFSLAVNARFLDASVLVNRVFRSMPIMSFSIKAWAGGVKHVSHVLPLYLPLATVGLVGEAKGHEDSTELNGIGGLIGGRIFLRLYLYPRLDAGSIIGTPEEPVAVVLIILGIAASMQGDVHGVPASC
jgi:hypothetical protein